MNSHGVVAIKDREVKEGDIQRVIDAAKAVKVSSDQDFIHVIPQEYIIDEQDGIKEPIGMSGVRLEAKVHLITGAVSAAQNIIKCIERCELKVNELVLEQLASSCSVLIEDEKDLGVCLVDTGGGTTDIAIFKGGAIRYTAVIPIAGDQVTNDIAVAFRTPTMNAEEIKIKSACALEELTKPEEMIDVPGVGERASRKLKRETLASVVHPRYEELFKLVLGKIKESGYENVIPAGVVLTGGSAKMEGAVDLAEEIFHMPVRLGLPQQVEGLKDVVSNPIHATGVGLLLYGMKDTGAEQEQEEEQEPVWNQIKSWFQEAF
jgi:cell division protein FtsA